MPLERLSILGVGLLGGSIGLAVKAAAMPLHITGYGHRAASLQAAQEMGAVDETTQDLALAVRSADLIILCTPVGLFEDLLRQIRPHLPKRTLITDVGSTKRSVVRLAEQLLPASAGFVGAHPMAGSEKRGVEWARADLFQGALCLVTPTPATDPVALQTVEQFWRGLGMRLQRLSPEAHDQQVGDISHLPHALAAALVAMQDEAALPLAGKGFLDTTRIAAGDGALWRDIFMDNRDNLKAGLTRLRNKVDELMELLEEQKGAELIAWLDAAAQRRAAVVRAKFRELE